MGARSLRDGRASGAVIRPLPLSLAALGIAVPLAGDGFAAAGLTAAWAIALCLVIAARAVWRPSPQMRVFAGLACLPLLALLAYEGGWWLIPAVVADVAIPARAAREPG